MNEKQQKEFDELAESYVHALHCMNIFIENNGLDYNEVWDLANQAYDEDLRICNADN